MPIPPACIQAFCLLSDSEPSIQPLVGYGTWTLKAAAPFFRELSKLRDGAFPSHSAVFSGMILMPSDPKQAFTVECLLTSLGLCELLFRM